MSRSAEVRYSSATTEKTMPKKFEGKIAVVTGGSEGIGLATAKLFAKEGAYVFIMGRRQQELDAGVKKIGSNVSGVQGDVANLADLDRLGEIVSKTLPTPALANLSPSGPSLKSISTSCSTSM
jgi:NAD(P)-dependent dehydrogenase (short-subunit alcohol dehydrogenase family)